MSLESNRRGVLAGLSAGLTSAALSGRAFAAGGQPDLAPYLTPHKYGKLVLAGSADPGTFDWKAVDCPFVFSANDRFYMTYVGFDGIGYQTGLAESHDLVEWKRVRLILPRDPKSDFTRYNMAMMCILRDDELGSSAPLKKVDGRYVGAWHAYPNAGYEAGPAVIGLAFSDDLMKWEVGPPILYPQKGATWEEGGLYKPYLTKSGDTYYLFYNAKTAQTPWYEATGVATSKDLKTWTRYAGNPILPVGDKGALDDRFASDPCVLRHNGQWAMFYYGRSSRDGKCRELLALGDDPFHFAKTGQVLVDVGPKGTLDEDFAHKPSVISWKGDLYHFYCAVSGKWPDDIRGITMARSRAWTS